MGVRQVDEIHRADLRANIEQSQESVLRFKTEAGAQQRKCQKTSIDGAFANSDDHQRGLALPEPCRCGKTRQNRNDHAPQSVNQRVFISQIEHETFQPAFRDFDLSGMGVDQPPLTE